MKRRMHLTLILTTYTLSSHFTPHLTSHTQDPFFDTFIHFSFSSISAKTLLSLPIAHFGRPNTHKNSSPTSLYSFLHFPSHLHLLPLHFLSSFHILHFLAEISSPFSTFILQSMASSSSSMFILIISMLG